MAELRDVTQKLAENNAQNMIGHQYTANEISKLNDRFDKFFRFLKEQQGDKLEDRRERKSSAAAATSALVDDKAKFGCLHKRAKNKPDEVDSKEKTHRIIVVK